MDENDRGMITGHQPFWRSPLIAGIVLFVMGQIANGIIYQAGERTSTALAISKISELERWKLEKESQINRIDKEGTTHSTWMIQQMFSINEKQDKRLENLESNSGKIDVIAEKMSRMQSDVAELMGRK